MSDEEIARLRADAQAASFYDYGMRDDVLALADEAIRLRAILRAHGFDPEAAGPS